MHRCTSNFIAEDMQTPAHARVVLIALIGAANHLLPVRRPAELFWRQQVSVRPVIQAVDEDLPKNNSKLPTPDCKKKSIYEEISQGLSCVSLGQK